MRVFSAGYKLVILAEMNEILEIIFFNFRYFLNLFGAGCPLRGQVAPTINMSLGGIEGRFLCLSCYFIGLTLSSRFWSSAPP